MWIKCHLINEHKIASDLSWDQAKSMENTVQIIQIQIGQMRKWEIDKNAEEIQIDCKQ